MVQRFGGRRAAYAGTKPAPPRGRGHIGRTALRQDNRTSGDPPAWIWCVVCADEVGLAAIAEACRIGRRWASILPVT